MDATAVAAAPRQRADAAEQRSWSRVLFSRTGAIVGYGLTALAVALGWALRETIPLHAGEGIGYALGIAGGALMLILLLYSARKRVRLMRALGKMKYWFRGHMMLGIAGPTLILFHCNFNVGSLNSQVALYCALLVAFSGIVGRYLYAQIHLGLYGRKASLRQLTEQLKESSDHLSGSAGLIRDVRVRLIALGEDAAQPPDNLFQSLYRPVAIGVRSRWLYHRLNWIARKELMARALTSAAIEQHQERLLAATREFIGRHLALIRRIAQFDFFERLFSWWHIVHVPFFLMMVLSGVVHVLAVHMY
jgi:hypothetical protein